MMKTFGTLGVVLLCFAIQVSAGRFRDRTFCSFLSCSPRSNHESSYGAIIVVAARNGLAVSNDGTEDPRQGQEALLEVLRQDVQLMQEANEASEQSIQKAEKELEEREKRLQTDASQKAPELAEYFARQRNRLQGRQRCQLADLRTVEQSGRFRLPPVAEEEKTQVAIALVAGLQVEGLLKESKLKSEHLVERAQLVQQQEDKLNRPLDESRAQDNAAQRPMSSDEIFSKAFSFTYST